MRKQAIQQRPLRSVVWLLLILWTAVAPTSANDVAPGAMAPDFTLKSLNGENLRLKEQRGDVVVVHFFANWCSQCRQEMAQLQKLHEQLHAAGLVVFAVSIDEDPQHAREMASDLKLTFPVLLDAQKSVGERYQVENLPTTWFIDRDGKLRYQYRSFQPGFEKQYANQLRGLLAE